MNRLLLLFLLIFTICLVGCFGSSTVPNENSITLSLDDDFASVVNLEEIPSFTFEFEGTLNTNKNVTKNNYTIFSNNEDIILSDALNKLFEKYKDRMYVDVIGSDEVSTTLFSTLDQFGKVENVEYTPDDKKVYEETAYISLENGLKLSIDYRRFVYNGENYYTWKYTSSITMYLYYPMMAVKKDMMNEIVLISLPNRITFSVGPTLKLSSILNQSSYIDSPECVYYTFKYLPDLDENGNELPIDVKQQYVIDYYVNDMNGTYDEENKIIYYSYLGNNFKVELYDANFKMHYVG